MKGISPKEFREKLLAWDALHNYREMPWKGEHDPYLVWLSEVILQQTRVAQGLPYYLKFKKLYPTVHHLAASPEDEVLRHWQGLGYYTRARNLHHTARRVAWEMGGQFPTCFSELKKLKGVGDYTAAAIASFVYNEPVAVVDGNVVRVLARVFGVDSPMDTPAGMRVFKALATKLVCPREPGRYNQAIMDFGSNVCKPSSPACDGCVFQRHCVAYRSKSISELPHRANKIKIRDRFFYYLLVHNRTHLLLRKRTGNDIWRHLYELPLVETGKPISHLQITGHIREIGFRPENTYYISDEIRQMLSHQKIHFRFIHLMMPVKILRPVRGTVAVTFDDINRYGFPKTIAAYLHEFGAMMTA
ncbi:MAG: A/G-specific adenine glycosylase [Chitinophagales bacterium]|nr:A/G-specific adenine glycosylase [Chitinophagales bacterium]MDW8419669.1 A/G-specific adenine glycosylase [Chitinophagales bacterium]